MPAAWRRRVEQAGPASAALGDFLICKQEPQGYQSDDARFVVEQVSHDGRIDGRTEFAGV